MADTEQNWRALAILIGFAAARILFSLSVGLGVDESYTVAISRHLSLSYFDHPPLHLWIVHFTALALGENVALRTVFVILFIATGWIYFRAMTVIFGNRPAFIALFALNVTPFFFASAGGWIVPDGPLLFSLAVTAWAGSHLFFRQPIEEASAWRFWLLVGLGLGLAGLSKYSAILTAGGVAAFILLAPEERRWLKHPAPYVSAIVACLIITPVILWNAHHNWASFEFQGERGVPSGELHPAQWAIMNLGEIVFLSPWIFAPLVAGLANSFRHWRDQRHMFLLCLSLPPIVLFSLTPLWGGRGQPHWTMPGWFFAFAAMGVWVSDFNPSVKALRRCAFVTTALLVAIAGLAAVQASTGWPWKILAARSSIADPTLETFEWTALKNAPLFHPPPSFVISTKWSDAGKIALALGPHIPVFVLSNDSRGWAFLDESERFVGQNGVIVATDVEAAPILAVARTLFAKVGQPELFSLGRRGGSEITLVLIPAIGLTHGLPMPYSSAAGR
jgi:hypothetical protein